VESTSPCRGRLCSALRACCAVRLSIVITRCCCRYGSSLKRRRSSSRSASPDDRRRRRNSFDAAPRRADHDVATFPKMVCIVAMLAGAVPSTPRRAAWDPGVTPTARVVVRPQSFRQFADTLPESTGSDDAGAQFDEYKLNWDVEAGTAFFRAHHFEEWLRQRYHPRELVARQASLCARSRQEASTLMRTLGASSLASDVIDSLPATLLKQAEMGLPTSATQLWCFVDPRTTLVISSLPSFVSEGDLMATLAPLPGFRSLLLSDPSCRPNSKCVARVAAVL
jgi:hypothetical protein